MGGKIPLKSSDELPLDAKPAIFRNRPNKLALNKIVLLYLTSVLHQCNCLAINRLLREKFLQFVLKKKDAAIMQIRLCADQYLVGSSLGSAIRTCILFLRVTQTELSPNQKQQSTKDSHSHSLKKSSINAIDHVEQLHLNALFSLSEANPCPKFIHCPCCRSWGSPGQRETCS